MSSFSSSSSSTPNPNEGLQFLLSVRTDRPVSDCEMTAQAYLSCKGGSLDNQARARFMDNNPHTFIYKWARGPKRPCCCNIGCSRLGSYEPSKWSRASCGGLSYVCGVCERGKQMKFDASFCSIE